MKRPLRPSRAAFIVPLVLLTVALLEDLATYRIRHLVRSAQARTVIIVLLNGIMFTTAAEWLAPLLKTMLSRARTHSRRYAGTVGPSLFYAAAYGAIYYAYLVVEARGEGALLKGSLW